MVIRHIKLTITWISTWIISSFICLFVYLVWEYEGFLDVTQAALELIILLSHLLPSGGNYGSIPVTSAILSFSWKKKMQFIKNNYYIRVHSVLSKCVQLRFILLLLNKISKKEILAISSSKRTEAVHLSQGTEWYWGRGMMQYTFGLSPSFLA